MIVVKMSLKLKTIPDPNARCGFMFIFKRHDFKLGISFDCIECLLQSMIDNSECRCLSDIVTRNGLTLFNNINLELKNELCEAMKQLIEHRRVYRDI